MERQEKPKCSTSTQSNVGVCRSVAKSNSTLGIETQAQGEVRGNEVQTIQGFVVERLPRPDGWVEKEGEEVPWPLSC